MESQNPLYSRLGKVCPNSGDVSHLTILPQFVEANHEHNPKEGGPSEAEISVNSNYCFKVVEVDLCHIVEIFL